MRPRFDRFPLPSFVSHGRFAVALLAAFALSMVAGVGLATGARAASDAAFPKDWASWPAVSSGIITGTETPIPPAAPKILQETLKTYNWVSNGKGSAYRVHLRPAQTDAFLGRKGRYADGPTAVLALTDIGVILVTDHLVGEPQYGVFTFDGKDLEGAHPSLRSQTCTSCHSGYADICIAGVCAAPRK